MVERSLPLFKWRDALALRIRTECKAPVISNYQLSAELLKLVTEGKYSGRALAIPKRPVDRRMFYEARRSLIEKGQLIQDKQLPNTYLRFPERKSAEAIEVLCAIDPFGHIAYMSAMVYHGLTNRLPRVIYFITPDSITWQKQAAERMTRDLGDLEDNFRASELPDLRHTRIKKLEGMIIETFKTKELGGWRHARDAAIRVTTLGRTFLQMLQRPDLCGGIQHVMDIYREHAELNLSSIISEFSQSGAKIDRVRAGYILEDRCGISDPRIDAWAKDASRGGSRKLDPQAEYMPKFSEKWCISINV